MNKFSSSALTGLFMILSILFGACVPASGPELTTRAYFDAINNRDRAKFLSLWQPEMQKSGETKYDYYVTFKVKYPEVKKIVSGDFRGNADIKDMTVAVVEESSFGKFDKTLKFGIVHQDDQWYILTPP